MNKDFPVHVEKTPEGDYLLTWTEDFSEAPVTVYADTSPDIEPEGEPVARTQERELRLAGLEGGPRHYFYLEPEEGEGLRVAQRDIPLEGGTNFRDLGGYRNREGRRVRWGRLFRSGHSANLTERDQEVVAALGILVCCDFRREEERLVEATRLPPSTRVVGVTITPGSQSSFFEELRAGGVRPEQMAQFMEHINREFVQHHTEQYRRMFEELLALEEARFMINCAAGKDRTGFGAAMILAALGVPEETILADYLLSGRYFPIQRELARVIHKYGAEAGGNLNPELILPMMETRPEYLQAAFDTIHDEYGSLDSFLEDALGIGPEERRVLRERLTA